MRVGLRLLSGAALAATIIAAGHAGSAVDRPDVVRVAQLPDIPIASLQRLPGGDRGVQLGGIGSGLFAIGANEYWTVTDRGPNADAGDLKTYLLADFTPELVQISVRGKALQVERTIPIVTPAGTPVTGLPNFAKTDDPQPVLSDGVTAVNYNPNGIDSEGVVRTANGHFWIVEEYGPSILELDATGHVMRRFVPSGTEAAYADVPQSDGSVASAGYPVVGALPSGLAKRRANRGFEDIALLPDKHTVVVALQSPPDESSTVTTLITFDTATGRVVDSVGYQFDPAATFDKGDAEPKDLKVSALIPVDESHVIVEERTDDEARFYTVVLPQADGLIAGTDKAPLANLAGIKGVPEKIEGAALKDGNILVVISDNDFGFESTTYPLNAKVDSSHTPTVLAEVRLPDRPVVHAQPRPAAQWAPWDSNPQPAD